MLAAIAKQSKLFSIAMPQGVILEALDLMGYQKKHSRTKRILCYFSIY
jgi:hypothetical protein